MTNLLSNICQIVYCRRLHRLEGNGLPPRRPAYKDSTKCKSVIYHNDSFNNMRYFLLNIVDTKTKINVLYIWCGWFINIGFLTSTGLYLSKNIWHTSGTSVIKKNYDLIPLYSSSFCRCYLRKSKRFWTYVKTISG